MPEHARDPRTGPSTALRVPPVEDWDSWPFAGPVTPKTLREPEPEPPREGEGGRPCEGCELPDDAYVWTDDSWRLRAFGPSGLPFVGVLEPREHVDSPADLGDERLAEMGIMLARVERAVLAVADIERVHILRYGEGASHLHWWFMGRETGLRQTASGFAMIWDDVLPTVPEDRWRANIATIVEVLRSTG